MHSIGNSMGSGPVRRRSVCSLMCAVLLALAPGAFAQPAPAQQPAQPPAQQAIQQQMTPAQFKAAGLDRLDAEQLANLNAWLNGTIQAEASKAAVTAKKRLEDDHRGFLNFGSIEPVIGKISGDFRGFGRSRSYTLENGQVWQQMDDASLAGVKLSNPQVKITPSLIGNAWYLQVGHYNTRAKVVRIK